MRNAYLSALYELAKANKQILALVSDNGAIVYDKFRKDFSAQFLNFGIAEANMVSVASGLAASGKIPFCYTIASFLTMRAFEQIRVDICLQNMNVKLVGIGAGFVYSNLGPTHHAIEDICIMRVLPYMTVFSPADPLEAKKVTLAAARICGPVYIRLSTGGTPSVYEEDYDFKVGSAVTLREGSDIAIIATGSIIHEVLKAVKDLEKKGRSIRLINMHTLKPIDKEVIFNAGLEIGAILTVEEHSVIGGLGSAVAEVLMEKKEVSVEFKRLGLNDSFPCGYGSYDEMKAANGLSKDKIIKAAESILNNKKTTKKLKK